MKKKLVYSVYILCLFFTAVVVAKMPPPIDQCLDEPIKYVGKQQTDNRYHHGGLRHVVGVHRYQAFRANREQPAVIGSRSGWTYSHQPYLCYWNKQFYLQYLSNQYTEHLTPGRTLLMTSKDGRHWSNPEIIFPEYSLPEIDFVDPETQKNYKIQKGTKAVMHQRMGFYIASDGTLLTLAFYSYCPITRIGPNDGHGLGRVVREVYKDGTYGPIYFIRYNRHAGWNENNTNYAFYKKSPDKDFVKACDELLADKLVTLQWWEEDRGKDGFFSIKPEGEEEPKAFNFFRRPDNVVVGIWKHQLTAMSQDNGQSWTRFAESRTLKTCGAKTWGQKTQDGRYALVYNHSATRRNRYPMVVMTSEDGHAFDNMLCLYGEVPPLRYYGWAKNRGPQYIRGIYQGNGNPPGNHMWNTFSMGKEDIWVTRTRVPISGNVDKHVNQDFEGLTTEADLEMWNFYIPKWAPIDIVNPPGTKNHVLRLSDEDPYDYAGADRAFPPSAKAAVEFSVYIEDLGKDILEFELHDKKDRRALRLRFDPDQEGITFDLGGVEPEFVPVNINKWYRVKVQFDCQKGEYSFWLDNKMLKRSIELDIKAPALERMVFRTGSWRSDVRLYFLNSEPSAPGLDSEDLPASADKVPQSIFLIDNVKTSSL